MTWTYTPDFTLTRDQIRIRIGDTDSTDEQLQDEEIAYAYTQAGSSVVGGAVLSAEWLAAKYARMSADTKVGDLSISYSQKAEAYRSLAADLRRKQGVSTAPVAGGISISRVDTEEADTDRVDFAFKVGMLDDPNAVESFNDEEKSSV